MEEEGRSKSTEKNPPNAYKIGDSWLVEFVFKGERYRKSIGAVSRSVAKEKARSKKTAVAEGRLEVNGRKWIGGDWVEAQTQKIEDPIFSVAMDQYLEFYKTENAAKTYKKYAMPASKNLRAFFDEYRLTQISLVLIEKYKRDRKTPCVCFGGATKETKQAARCSTCKRLIKARADATVNRELTLLRHMFNKCIDFQLARANPFRTVTKLADGTHRTQKVNMFDEKGRERYLSHEEAQSLLNACKRDLRFVVLAAMHTGFRSSELKALRWKNTDTVKGFVTVENRYSKNGETRTVPLSDDLLAALKESHQARRPNSEDFVFTHDNKPWKCWKEAFKGALKRAGIKNFTFHDLRHTYGSNLGMNDTNQKAMMELMGHKDPKMTLRYTHLSVDYKRQAVAKLPRLSMESESPEISPSTEGAKVVSFGK